MSEDVEIMINKLFNYFNKLNKYFYLLIIFFLFGCKSDIELAMERGIQYYEWEKIEEAILEFKYVIHNISSNQGTIKYDKIKLLSRAHHNLAVAYAKKSWYHDALQEAKKSFDLIPTDNNKQVINLINKKIIDKSKKEKNNKSTNL